MRALYGRAPLKTTLASWIPSLNGIFIVVVIIFIVAGELQWGSILFLSIGQKIQKFSDVRIKACTVEYYPGQLKWPSRVHHMAVVSPRIQHVGLSQQEKRYRTSARPWKKSVSEFIWAADKETPTLITSQPRLVLALLSILSWLQSTSLCHTVILDFYL